MRTAAAPFAVPVGAGTVHPGPWQVLKVEAYSDGEQKTWPGKQAYRPSNEAVYKIKLGRAWATQLGIIEAGVNYCLEELPHGYALFDETSHNYRRLFGHPSGKYFDSILRFQDHFLWLMGGMEGDCTCVLCGKREKPVIPRPRKPRDTVLLEPRRRRDLGLSDAGAESARSSSAGGLATGREKRARGLGQTHPVDEEGTRDVYKECIQRLHKNRESRKGIKDDIIEEDSLDHEAEHEALTNYFTRIEQQHSFVPRLGELVLWCNYFPDDHYLLKDTESNEFKFYSFEEKAFRGFPDWRAGVVTAVPNSSAVDGSIDFPDILDLPPKATNLNSSGFRVETIPDPNKSDKSASKQYRYLPLRSIRPLAHWQYVLYGFPQKRLHPSIYHALTLMTTISVLDTFEFTGEWPNGSIHCRAAYIGSELITIGDAVRILSVPRRTDDGLKSSINAWKLQPDILIISSIRMNLQGIEDRHVSTQSPVLCASTNITLIGSAYLVDRDGSYHRSAATGELTMQSAGGAENTLQIPTSVDAETAKHLFRPVGTTEYGQLYPITKSHQRYEVSHDQVIGRLHEFHAVKLWTGSHQFKHQPTPPSLTFDMPGILAGRRYATATDYRISEPPPDNPETTMWHLADYRAVALDIATSNGLDVGPYDEIRTKRTLSRWRAVLKARRGDMSAAKEIWTTQKGRPAGTRVVDGKLEYPDDMNSEGVVREPGTGKRRGRPPGTKVIDGKLVYLPGSQSQGMKSAAREETESEISVDNDMMELDEPGTRVMTGLDGNTSFEQRDSLPRLGDETEDDEGMLLADFQQSRQAGEDERPPRPPSSKGKAPVRSAPLTKEQIMRSVETGELADDEDDDEDEEEEEWWNEPPIVRGGTEESEGGDYDPKKESQAQRQERKTKERAREEEGARTKQKYVPGSDYRPWVKDW